MKTWREGCTPCLAALSAAIQGLPSQLSPRTPTVSAARKNAAGMYAELLREFPYLTMGVSADAIEAGLAVDAAMTLLKGDLQT